MDILSILIGRKFLNSTFKDRIKKSFLSENVKHLFKLTIMTFEESGINLKNELKDTTILFTSIKSIYYVDNYIFIILIDGKSVLIPIRTFDGIDDKNQFIKAICRNTGLNIETNFPRDYVYFRRRVFRRRVFRKTI